MQEMADSLDIVWSQLDIPRSLFVVSDENIGLFRHYSTTPLPSDEHFLIYFIYILLYVDDAADIFGDGESLTEGTNVFFKFE